MSKQPINKRYQTYYIDEQLVKKITEHSEKTELKKSAVVSRALRHFFDSQEQK